MSLEGSVPYADRMRVKVQGPEEPREGDTILIVDTRRRSRGGIILGYDERLTDEGVEVAGATVAEYVGRVQGVPTAITKITTLPEEGDERFVVGQRRSVQLENVLPPYYPGWQTTLATSVGFVRDTLKNLGIISPLLHRLTELGISIRADLQSNPQTLTVTQRGNILFQNG
ncbi:MAG: hypothetical protein ACREGI_04455 [Candidatus Levyibacteriota bacterium]